jgi:hypothetical protein
MTQPWPSVTVLYPARRAPRRARSAATESHAAGGFALATYDGEPRDRSTLTQPRREMAYTDPSYIDSVGGLH